ncbi:TIGR04222 domain-containing membrane protein [Hyalangium rubrum]|uniref:TIGR04222 domain-containing membrane protein n=1 Tax=Hyalangium rubrum TaxID=3103134 RepID=A0ABU5H9A2_9BACT|nr:TIGR04222 domain-containing membrane protein [Hyalangium sp. s54d21]MDY7230060.1 TIGR04222 domain-containing membrane protein [Hyalangium sp. s54d21]
MNPLDWSGTQFLLMYVPLMVVGYVVAWGLRRPSQQSDAAPDAIAQRLEPYEVALLKGFKTFRDAVTASLVHRGVFLIQDEELFPSTKPPSGMTRLEQSVHRAARGRSLARSELANILQTEAEPLREQLVRKGLLVDAKEAHEKRRVPAIVFGAVLALGAAKLALGLVRDRPVGILFFLLILGLIGFVSIFKMKIGRTPLGDKTLKSLVSKHEPLRTTAATEGSLPTLSGTEVALAVALFGTSAMAASQMEPLRRYLQPASTGGASVDSGADGCGTDYDSDTSLFSSSSSCSSSSDSSSSCSSSSSDSSSSCSSSSSSCGGCSSGGSSD